MKTRTARRKLKIIKRALLMCGVVCGVYLFMIYAYNRMEGIAKQCDALKGRTCTIYEIQGMRE